MALEDLVGGLYQFNMGLPLQYANPQFSFLNNQAGNMASLGNTYQGNVGSIGNQAIGGTSQLGNSAMGLYGSLANTQAGMYQSELPMQMEMQKFNALAPALSGLLGQFGGGLGGANISPISMNFNRPDVMSGYQGVVDNSYKQLGNVTNQAYGQARGAYDQSVRNTNAIGDQFNQQWQNLQDRVFRPQAPPPPPPRMSPPVKQVQSPGGAIFGPSPMPGPPRNSVNMPYHAAGPMKGW